MRHLHWQDEDWVGQMDQDFERADELWRRFLHSVAAPDRFWEPRADVYETRDAVKIRVELPGVKPDSIHVELAADLRSLTVAGVREEERHETEERVLFHQIEIYVGPFEREIPLPPDAEVERNGVEAVYRDGFLLATLPRRQKASTNQVRVSVKG